MGRLGVLEYPSAGTRLSHARRNKHADDLNARRIIRGRIRGDAMIIWTCSIRAVGIFLALLMGVIIIQKMRKWRDLALYWLLAGMSIGPLVVLSWNIIFRLFLAEHASAADRITWLGNFQIRYVYEIINTVLNTTCLGAVIIGLVRLYRNPQRRYRMVRPAEFVSNDPRS